MTTAEILSLPRAAAFAQGLLIPVAPWRRKEHKIPLAVRFTPAAWEALIAYPGPRGGEPDPRWLDGRLEKVLAALGTAIHSAGVACFRDATMTVLMPSWVGPIRSRGTPLHVLVITTRDEEGQDALTVLLPHEAPPTL
jgi:hypothetical protein